MLAVVLLSAAAPLPRCTVAVAGANGRVGSMICRELLRNHPQVTVRALVRDAQNPYEGYGRLSYEVGAEDGKMDLRPAWSRGEDGGFAQPATMEFDENVMATYGLDRLEIRECELRYAKDVEAALSDVDAVVYCATSFNNFRQRLPDRLDEAAGRIAQGGMALFELRFGDALFGKQRGRGDGAENSDASKERRAEARGKTADVEGLENTLRVVQKSRARRASLAALTGGQAGAVARVGVPFVLISGSGALGYDSSPYSSEVRENEFGFRKRTAESTLRASELGHVIVRSAAIDDVRVDEGLPVRTSEQVVIAEQLVAAGGKAAEEGAVGVRDDDAKKRRIHPRDLARFAVRCLVDEPGADGGSRTVEVHTFVLGEVAEKKPK